MESWIMVLGIIGLTLPVCGILMCFLPDIIHRFKFWKLTNDLKTYYKHEPPFSIDELETFSILFEKWKLMCEEIITFLKLGNMFNDLMRKFFERLLDEDEDEYD